MNRKLALLMFAIGLGAASAPALAASCQSICAQEYRACIASGMSVESCSAERQFCLEQC